MAYINPFRVFGVNESTTEFKIKSATAKFCILCGKLFSSDEIGLLNCKIHPLKYNELYSGDKFGLDHYECCGASRNTADITHYEESSPKGCHKIDHVSDQSELNSILRTPFKCVPKKIAENFRLLSHKKEITENQYIIPILNIGQLDWDYGFNIPFKREYEVDVSIEYENMLRDYNLVPNCGFDGNTFKSSDLYTLDDDENSTLLKEQDERDVLLRVGQDFVPFYVIRRLDYVTDRTKSREIRSRKCCMYE